MKEIVIHIDGKPVSRIVGSVRIAAVAPLLAGEAEVYLVYDRNVAWVADAVEAALTGAGASRVCGRMALEATEVGKDMAMVMDICAWLLASGASRGALLLAIGGGITTDIAGFAASIYKRGIRYANIPTTLLAQVDAGIGGKTGVNFDAYKNMLGVIVQPAFTFLSAEVLATLSPRDFRSGAAELLKTFLIENRDGGYERAVRLLSFRNEGENGNEWTAELQALVFAAAAVKAGVVSRDPYERGERRCLNLGHTFAHAIEHNARLRGDDITHGEAVAMGMVLAAGLAGPGMKTRLRADFTAAGLPVACPYPLEALEEAMGKDKKAAGGRVRFQLPVAIGRVEEVELTPREVISRLVEAEEKGRADAAPLNENK